MPQSASVAPVTNSFESVFDKLGIPSDRLGQTRGKKRFPAPSTAKWDAEGCYFRTGPDPSDSKSAVGTPEATTEARRLHGRPAPAKTAPSGAIAELITSICKGKDAGVVSPLTPKEHCTRLKLVTGALEVLGTAKAKSSSSGESSFPKPRTSKAAKDNSVDRKQLLEVINRLRQFSSSRTENPPKKAKHIATPAMETSPSPKRSKRDSFKQPSNRESSVPCASSPGIRDQSLCPSTEDSLTSQSFETANSESEGNMGKNEDSSELFSCAISGNAKGSIRNAGHLSDESSSHPASAGGSPPEMKKVKHRTYQPNAESDGSTSMTHSNGLLPLSPVVDKETLTLMDTAACAQQAPHSGAHTKPPMVSGAPKPIDVDMEFLRATGDLHHGGWVAEGGISQATKTPTSFTSGVDTLTWPLDLDVTQIVQLHPDASEGAGKPPSDARSFGISEDSKRVTCASQFLCEFGGSTPEACSDGLDNGHITLNFFKPQQSDGAWAQDALPQSALPDLAMDGLDELPLTGLQCGGATGQCVQSSLMGFPLPPTPQPWLSTASHCAPVFSVGVPEAEPLPQAAMQDTGWTENFSAASAWPSVPTSSFAPTATIMQGASVPAYSGIPADDGKVLPPSDLLGSNELCDNFDPSDALAFEALFADPSLPSDLSFMSVSSPSCSVVGDEFSYDPQIPPQEVMNQFNPGDDFSYEVSKGSSAGAQDQEPDSSELVLLDATVNQFPLTHSYLDMLASSAGCHSYSTAGASLKLKLLNYVVENFRQPGGAELLEDVQRAFGEKVLHMSCAGRLGCVHLTIHVELPQQYLSEGGDGVIPSKKFTLEGLLWRLTRGFGTEGIVPRWCTGRIIAQLDGHIMVCKGDLGKETEEHSEWLSDQCTLEPGAVLLGPPEQPELAAEGGWEADDGSEGSLDENTHCFSLKIQNTPIDVVERRHELEAYVIFEGTHIPVTSLSSHVTADNDERDPTLEVEIQVRVRDWNDSPHQKGLAWVQLHIREVMLVDKHVLVVEDAFMYAELHKLAPSHYCQTRQIMLCQLGRALRRLSGREIYSEAAVSTVLSRLRQLLELACLRGCTNTFRQLLIKTLEYTVWLQRRWEQTDFEDEAAAMLQIALRAIGQKKEPPVQLTSTEVPQSFGLLHRAVISQNCEMMHMLFDVGRLLDLYSAESEELGERSIQAQLLWALLGDAHLESVLTKSHGSTSPLHLAAAITGDSAAAIAEALILEGAAAHWTTLQDGLGWAAVDYTAKIQNDPVANAVIRTVERLLAEDAGTTLPVTTEEPAEESVTHPQQPSGSPLAADSQPVEDAALVTEFHDATEFYDAPAKVQEGHGPGHGDAWKPEISESQFCKAEGKAEGKAEEPASASDLNPVDDMPLKPKKQARKQALTPLELWSSLTRPHAITLQLMLLLNQIQSMGIMWQRNAGEGPIDRMKFFEVVYGVIFHMMLPLIIIHQLADLKRSVQSQKYCDWLQVTQVNLLPLLDRSSKVHQYSYIMDNSRPLWRGLEKLSSCLINSHLHLQPYIARLALDIEVFPGFCTLLAQPRTTMLVELTFTFILPALITYIFRVSRHNWIKKSKLQKKRATFSEEEMASCSSEQKASFSAESSHDVLYKKTK
ncbi:hypothetical protein CYMTET_23522 [Cymbomonas tetramitiformis]|uniref:Uncharacterized protein n=1 Tax=Cymbomonas tetramitiformis TaxID=36881 RepID=A0AAE0L144_9CHLO|nr:hypothetical protein CYMTET_23522 [Cymbomonas tetramitiformis]